MVMWHPTGQRFALALYVSLAAFVIAHTVNAFVANALYQPIPGVSPMTPSPVVAHADTQPGQLVDEILLSGFFPLPTQPIELTATGEPLKPKKPPLEVAKKIRLRGTVVGDRGGVLAVIEELQTKRQTLVRLHEEIPNVGEVVEVRKDGVVIRLDDQEELLVPSVTDLEPPHASMTPIVPVAQVIASPPRRVLDRREVNEAMGNVSRLLTQAHAVPYFTKAGAIDGFRLDFVEPASFYDKIGLQYGDILQRVNGVEVRDPGRMWNLFQQVQNERLVKVDILRQSQKVTLAFELR
jgi:general secretion pathway protein C